MRYLLALQLGCLLNLEAQRRPVCASSTEGELVGAVHRGWGTGRKAGRRRDRLVSRLCVALEAARAREELKGPERK